MVQQKHAYHRRIVSNFQDMILVLVLDLRLKHSREQGHTHVWDKDFEVLGNNYRSPFKRRISEALFIKQLKPSFNTKEKLIRLHLYN